MRGTGVAGVLFIDLDDFKTVNDSLGHAVGDELLIGVAERLGQLLPGRRGPARLGGDEFAVLVDDSGDEVGPGRPRPPAAERPAPARSASTAARS